MDLESFVAGMPKTELHVLDAELVVDAATRAAIRREGDPAMVEAIDAATPLVDDGARYTVRVPYESIERAAADVMRLGPGVEVTAMLLERQYSRSIASRPTP